MTGCAIAMPAYVLSSDGCEFGTVFQISTDNAVAIIAFRCWPIWHIRSWARGRCRHDTELCQLWHCHEWVAGRSQEFAALASSTCSPTESGNKQQSLRFDTWISW